MPFFFKRNLKQFSTPQIVGQENSVRIYCYFNIHKKCFSVKALEGPDKGRVIAHANAVLMATVEFRVSRAGRARVLLERRKNVHAGVVGDLVSLIGRNDVSDEIWVGCQQRFEKLARPISYNPYRNETFVHTESGAAIYAASECLLSGRIALAIT